MRRLLNVRPAVGPRLLLGAIPLLAALLFYCGAAAIQHGQEPWREDPADQGIFVSVVGPSRAGRSTFLRLEHDAVVATDRSLNRAPDSRIWSAF